MIQAPPEHYVNLTVDEFDVPSGVSGSETGSGESIGLMQESETVLLVSLSIRNGLHV